MKHTLIRTVPDQAPAEQFSGCSVGRTPAAKRAPNAPPIFVNGVEIPEAAIAQEAQNHSAASGPEARGAAARALVIRALLLERARVLALAPEPATVDAGRRETDEEALVRAVLAREAPASEPNDDECRRVYATSPKRFEAPELYEASHVLFAPRAGDQAADAEAEAAARAAIAKLVGQSGGFAALAAEVSSCPSAGQGGSLGQLQRGDLAPEVEAAVLALEPGDIAAAPVRTRHGWHVVRLDRRIPARVLPFEMVAPRIRAALHARAQIAASIRYIEALARDARIEGMTLSIGAGGAP